MILSHHTVNVCVCVFCSDLSFNNISVISKRWLYGLNSLQRLYVAALLCTLILIIAVICSTLISSHRSMVVMVVTVENAGNGASIVSIILSDFVSYLDLGPPVPVIVTFRRWCCDTVLGK